jgi:surface carbohydrate biosynthesis protein
MHIGLIVDHPKRDLGGISLLAYQLAHRGVRVSIIPLYEQAVDVPLLGLDALVVNFARPANRDLVENYAAGGTRVYVLDTEGGVLAETGGNSPAALARYVRESGYGKLLAGYFFWGSRLHDAFLEDSGMSADRLHLTGCPRFDFAAPRWHPLLRFDRQGYLLVNANFPLVNPRFSPSPTHERDSMVRAGWAPDYVEGLLIDLRTVLEGYVDALRRLALDLSDQDILVRPHPFESEQFYRDAFADCPNVTIDGRGSVLNVIHNSACILHLNCGTAIEATMLGKLPIQLDWLNTERTANHAKLPSLISHRAGSLEELRAILNDLPAATDAFDFNGVYRQHIEPFFHQCDGMATTRVADVLMRDFARFGAKGGRYSISHALAGSRSRPSAGQRLKALVGTALGSHTAARLRLLTAPQRREKQIDPSKVNDLIGEIAQCDGDCRPQTRHARHPLIGTPLSTVSIVV